MAAKIYKSLPMHKTELIIKGKQIWSALTLQTIVLTCAIGEARLIHCVTRAGDIEEQFASNACKL